MIPGGKAHIYYTRQKKLLRKPSLPSVIYQVLGKAFAKYRFDIRKNKTLDKF